MTEPESHESHASLGHKGGRTPEQLIIAALVLLILLVVKPWGTTPEVATAPGSAATAAPLTAAAPKPAELPCTGQAWLIEADTRWAGQVVRSWILADAVEATGPTDPAITLVVVAGQQVPAIGYCSPHRNESRARDRVTIYRLGSPVTEMRAQSVPSLREANTNGNGLFAPVPMARPTEWGAAEGWTAGRYVLRVDGPEGDRRWLGIEVRIVAVANASPAASITP